MGKQNEVTIRDTKNRPQAAPFSDCANKFDGGDPMIDENGSVQRTNPHALMHLKNVCSLIGISRSTLHRLREKDVTFPAPIKDGDTRQAPVYFVQAEVEGWIRKKMNGRQAASNEA